MLRNRKSVSGYLACAPLTLLLLQLPVGPTVSAYLVRFPLLRIAICVLEWQGCAFFTLLLLPLPVSFSLCHVRLGIAIWSRDRWSVLHFSLLLLQLLSIYFVRFPVARTCNLCRGIACTCSTYSAVVAIARSLSRFQSYLVSYDYWSVLTSFYRLLFLIESSFNRIPIARDRICDRVRRSGLHLSLRLLPLPVSLSQSRPVAQERI